MRADADARIRRALLRRHRALRMPLVVGQKAFYWRMSGVPRLQKNRWRGPAVVVMREDAPETGRPMTYWIVHATSLLRVAPEHLRPAVEDDGRTDLRDSIDAAKEALQSVRGRSTTQYIDLRNSPAVPMDVDTDEEDEGPTPMDVGFPESNAAAPAATAQPAPPEVATPATPVREQTSTPDRPMQPEQEQTPTGQGMSPTRVPVPPLSFEEQRSMQERTEMTAIRQTPAQVRARVEARRSRKTPHPQDSSVPTSAGQLESQGQAHRHQEQMVDTPAPAPRDRSRSPSKELRYVQHVLEQFSVEAFGESFPADWILTESCVFELTEKT